MPLIKDEIRTARKSYPCGAYHWINWSCYGEPDFEPEDWATIKAAEADGFKIKSGMQYLYQASVDGDGWAEFRARLDMHEICRKYDLYPED